MSTGPAPPEEKEEKIRRALDVLGLAEGAERDHIRRAYRRLALAFHPDRHPGRRDMEERFQEVTEAYHLLMADLPGEGSGEGEAPAGPAPERGRDIFFRVRLDFLQAARGG